MTVDPFASTTAIGAAVQPGMPVDLALIFSACHVMPSSGERIPLPRPQKDTVRGQIRKLANQLKISCFKKAIGAQKSSRLDALERLRSGLVTNRRHLRIFIRLDEYRSPQTAFTFDHESSEIK